MSIVFETSIGDFTIDLYTKQRPKGSFNFLKLCKIKYFNYNLVFDIKKGFAARTGDPTNTGQGGESVYWKDKSKNKKYFRAEKTPIIKHNKPGLISMINDGNDQHGSQFVITLGSDNLSSLDKQGNTVIGEIVEGLEIIKKLNETMVDESDRPFRDICISHTVIISDPFEDPDYVRKYARRGSPDIPDYLIDSDRVAIYDDLSIELEVDSEEKDTKAKATILEMIGDIPDADAKPPENVLFVCKLNPITQADDLDRIFSRFGEINSVNLVKDPKTGESLQYAFIEYNNKEDCEKAYIKMDKVILDDRRIHVDFSQSLRKK